MGMERKRMGEARGESPRGEGAAERKGRRKQAGLIRNT